MKRSQVGAPGASAATWAREDLDAAGATWAGQDVYAANRPLSSKTPRFKIVPLYARSRSENVDEACVVAFQKVIYVSTNEPFTGVYVNCITTLVSPPVYTRFQFGILGIPSYADRVCPAPPSDGPSTPFLKRGCNPRRKAFHLAPLLSEPNQVPVIHALFIVLVIQACLSTPILGIIAARAVPPLLF